MAESVVTPEYPLQNRIAPRMSDTIRLVLIGFLVGAAYYVGAMIGFALTFPTDAVSTLWPPNAILLAALLLMPNRRWWLVLLSAFPAHLAVQLQSGVPFLMVLGWFISNCSEALIGAWCIRRFIDGPLNFDSLKNVSVFIAFAVIFSPFMSSFLDAAFVVLVGWKADGYWEVWRMRLPSNVLAALTLVPVIVDWSINGADRLARASLRRYAEASLLIFGLVTVSFLVFGWQTAGQGAAPALVYMPLPFLLWAAVRFGPGGASTSLLVVVLLSIWGATQGRGPFVTSSAEENVLSLQIFLIAISLPLMFLAALIEERREKEKALGESEARYRALVMAGAEMVWRANADGEGLFVTPGWQHLTGQSEGEMGNSGWLDAVHPDDRERSALLWQHSVMTKRAYENELRVRTRDGNFRHFHVHAVPILAPDGSVYEWVGANTDITDRKRAESRLNLLHTVTRILSESASIAEAAPRVIQTICQFLDWELGEIWRVDREANVLAFLEVWHLSSEDFAEFTSASRRFTFSSGRGLPGKVWKNRKPAWIRDVSVDVNFLRASLAAKAGLRSAFSFPILLGDETVGVMVFFSREIREPNEEVLKMMADIGSQIGQLIDRKHTEEALRESEERLARTQKFSLVMVTHTNLEGRWIKVPPTLCELLGYTEEELLARRFYDVTHPDDIEANASLRARLSRGEIKSFDLEKRYIRKDGSIVWVYLNVSVVADAAGKPVHCLSYIRDITERKHAEDALRESEARLKLAMEAARIGYWELEVGSGKVARSESLEHIFGVTPGKMAGTREAFFSLVHAEDFEIPRRQVERCIESLESHDTEYRIVRPDGTIRWIASRCQGVPGLDGRALRVLGMVADITERKRAEEEIQRLKERLEAENVYLRAEVSGADRFGELTGESEAIEKVIHQVEQVAATDMTVLLLGETGTGKELVARAVHARSTRKDRPLVKVNCSALPSELIESELFGHEKGSFTGATARQIGRFELADGATIFLDEIGELPLKLQAKLLRVLQEGEFERLGSAKTIRVDVRVIAATNRDLLEAIQRGRFRADLYYRLNVYPIQLPPLRERKEDIDLLATTFLKEASTRLGRTFDLPLSVIETLRRYDWPGNVRELQNVIERAAVISTGRVLQLPKGWEQPLARTESSATSMPFGKAAMPVNGESVRELTLDQFERAHILQALEQTGWRIEGPRGAALILGLNPSTLRSRMQKLGIRSRRQVRSPTAERMH